MHQMFTQLKLAPIREIHQDWLDRAAESQMPYPDFLRDLGGRRGDLPNAEAFAVECLRLAMFAEITPDQQAPVADAPRRAVAG